MVLFTYLVDGGGIHLTMEPGSIAPYNICQLLISISVLFMYAPKNGVPRKRGSRTTTGTDSKPRLKHILDPRDKAPQNDKQTSLPASLD